MRPNTPSRAGRVRFACLLVPLCGLFGLILLAIGIGFLLPKEYQGSHSAVLPHPPALVWGAVNDFRRYPVSGSSARAVEELAGEPEAPSWREDLGQVSLHVRTLRRIEPTHVERGVRGMNTPLDARFRIELIPVAQGTKLTVTQHIEVQGTTLGVPFARLVYFFGGAEQWARDYVNFLERGLERGS